MSNMNLNILQQHSELGKKAEYDSQYNPDKLFSISRKEQRKELGIADELPFFGHDIWNHYEVSWLNEKGKPVAALAEMIYPCDSPCLIESKSMKLYFNSLNNRKFPYLQTVQSTITHDLVKKVGTQVSVKIIPISEFNHEKIVTFDGKCLDELDVNCTVYTVDPSFLTVENEIADETLYSNLLKSNCLVTNQPDWGSVQIIYKGKKINHEGLLRYIISFRNHNEFHEHCIERIFIDIMRICNPEELTVYGRYTRRGGIDINPYRSTQKEVMVKIK